MKDSSKGILALVLGVVAVGAMSLGKNKILSYAKKWLGEKEKPNNQGFYNSVLEKKMKAIGFVKGYQYCVFFVKMVLANTLKGEQRNYILSLMNGSSLTTWNKFVKTKDRTHYYISSKPVSGAIAFYIKSKKDWRGHAEIVDKVKGKKFTVVTGNTVMKTGYQGIAQRERSTNLRKNKKFALLGFVVIK